MSVNERGKSYKTYGRGKKGQQLNENFIGGSLDENSKDNKARTKNTTNNYKMIVGDMAETKVRLVKSSIQTIGIAM